ncbi:hypothetical protein U1Q18_041690 [Sarracenia purpurea var. burkii]
MVAEVLSMEIDRGIKLILPIMKIETLEKAMMRLAEYCGHHVLRQSGLDTAGANGTNLGRCGTNVDSDPNPNNVKMLIGIADEMLKQKNVDSVLFGGKRILDQSNFEKLDWFAGELLLEHQRRSCRIAPTVAFKQATPRPT